jgi:hypothetical protein
MACAVLNPARIAGHRMKRFVEAWIARRATARATSRASSADVSAPAPAPPPHSAVHAQDQMARPSASSRRSCGSGPTPCRTAVRTTAPPTCPDGCATTIRSDRMLASPASPLPPGSRLTPEPCSETTASALRSPRFHTAKIRSGHFSYQRTRHLLKEPSALLDMHDGRSGF